MQFGLQLSFDSKQTLGSKLQVFRDRMIAARWVKLRDFARRAYLACPPSPSSLRPLVVHALDSLGGLCANTRGRLVRAIGQRSEGRQSAS